MGNLPAAATRPHHVSVAHPALRRHRARVPVSSRGPGSQRRAAPDGHTRVRSCHAGRSATVTADKTVLFVCLHGAGMSRLAAAYFDQSAPVGWCAVSAGLEPGETLSHTAARLLAGTPTVA